MKNMTQKNIETLASRSVDNMDLDALCMFAQEHLEEHYSKLSRKEFNEEWDFVIGED